MRKELLILSFVMLILPGSAYANQDVFEAMRTKLKYLSNRQSVLSTNIANANTPGYKARDLKAVNFNEASRNRAGKLSLMATTPGHIRSKTPPLSFRTMKQVDVYETAPDGNNVSIEQQTMKLSENNLEYQSTINLMSKMTKLIKTAIGDNTQ